MKIFDKRPLSLILCMLLGGFVFFSVSGAGFKIALPSIGALILLFVIFVPKNRFKGRILTVISASALLIGCLCSFLFFDLYYRIDKKFSGSVEICGVVTECESNAYGKNLAIKIETINGEKYKGRTVFTFLSLEDSENISSGSRINVVGTISSIDDEESDSASYYYAAGYSAALTDISSIEYVEYAGLTIKSRISNYRSALCRRIILSSDKESGGLISALLLGEREYLSSETRHDFARVGLSHVLALSGMHLAIISFAIEMLLSKVGIMKKPRKIIQILFVLVYMALTGFPASVMRAGIMLIFTSLMFLLSHRADSITSLFIAVVVIIIAEPYAIFDIGLWLSMFATLGILLFIEFHDAINKKTGKATLKTRLIRILVLPVFISAFAFGSTFLLSALTFKKFSLLAMLTTPIYGIAIEIYMYLGLAVLICGRFLSIGSIAGPIGNAIIKSVMGISSINGIYLSAEYAIIRILIVVFTVALIAFAVLDIKRKRGAVALLMGMLFLIFATALFCSVDSAKADRFEYSVSDGGEFIVMQNDGGISLLDLTTPSTRAVTRGTSLVQDYGITQLDCYVFTTYSAYTQSAVDKLLGSIYVKDVFIPLPQSDTEILIAEKIIKENAGSKSEFHFYQSDKFISCGDFNIFPEYRSSNKNKRALTILYNDKFYTYLSSGMLEDDTKNVALPLIDGCNTLILGRHGNSYSNYRFIYQVENLDTLVISGKNISVPAETTRYYNSQGTDLYYFPEKLELYVE